MPLIFAAGSPARLPGMGAIPDDQGATFRVWAPFAQAVYVTGNFSGFPADWTEGLVPLESDGSTWSGYVAGAKPGDAYRYVIIPAGGSLTAVSSWVWKMDPYGRDATAATGNSLIATGDFQWPATTFQMPSWNSLVIYELHIGTFNPQAQSSGGTLEDVIDKLDYLQDLGVNAIEVMPAADFDTETSMGYNTALPFALESAYGTANALKQFIAQAHARGIAVIMDVVYNHLGPQGLDACLWRFDGWYVDGYSGIYFYADARAQTAFGERPDFGRAEVRQYLRDNATMWLHEYQVDGLRLDSTYNIREAIDGLGNDQGPISEGWELLQWFANEKNAALPWKILIAEDLQNDDWLTKTTGAGGAGNDSQWDAWFLGRITGFLSAPSDQARDLSALGEAIGKSYNAQGMFQRVIYAESHDQADVARLPSLIDPADPTGYFARKRALLGAGVVMTAPGIPMLFMGAEFMCTTPWSDTTPLDWSLLTTYGGFHDCYRELIRYRRDWYDNSRGLSGQNINLFHSDTANQVLAYHRWDGGGAGDDVVVVVNGSNQAFPSYRVGFPRGGTWYLRLNTDDRRWSGDFSSIGYDTTADGEAIDGMGFAGNVGLGPYAVVLYSQ
jgi:1,4-alpha-glucan branching enzyme